MRRASTRISAAPVRAGVSSSSPRRIIAADFFHRDTITGRWVYALAFLEHRTRKLCAPRTPWMNAHCERAIGTLRRQVLDHIPVRNEAHAGRAFTEYQEPYNRHRPHQSRSQRPPAVQDHPGAVQDPEGPELVRTSVLAGSINEYGHPA
ncbi:integrase core domain-containing protein [Amycolatopsis circi]|uniref:integrase core domain-containing protein n=1 Tax=Amycolatopsis circi TaxID=871959 RepID=UPI003CC5E7BF